MKKLLEYLVKNVTGIEDFSVKEEVDGNFINFVIKVDPKEAGLVIGKQGKTIKTLRNILKVRAILEKKGVNISIEEK